MATILPAVRRPVRPPAAAAAASPAADALPQIAGLGAACFVGYVMIQAIEYGALSIYVPLLKASRLTTFLSYFLALIVVIRYKGRVLASTQAKLFLTFVVFTGAGILWAVVRSYVPLALRYHFDYFLLFLITAFIIDSRPRTNVLSIVFVGISILLVGTNLNMLGQDIRFGAFAAAYFMGDGNDFGWGLIVMLPFALYLMVGERRLLTRLFGAAGFVVSVVGIIGTESRGATLALAACMLLFWATVAKRKLLFVGILVVMVTGVALLAPPAYFARMNSIQNYEEDNSAQGRLRAWRAARQMALDYPLGVGANNFNSAYGRFYIPADTSGWAANRWMSTHSCYFKVLAEYGYPGLILFLSILIVSFRNNVLSARRLRRAEGATVFDPEWPLLLNVALLGYSVCAIFLGGITYPHLYILVGLTVGTTRMTSLPQAALAAAPVTDKDQAGSASPTGAEAPRAPRRRFGRVRLPAPAGSSEMVRVIFVWTFWVSMAGLVYAYFGYPLLLLVLARRRRDDGPGGEPEAWPSVVLLIPVHNERANIEAKLANAAALEYPGRLRVCFISDGLTDGTNEYIEGHADARTAFIALSGRNGKAGALNRALQEATEDIVVFTDASIMLAPDAIHRIVQPFTDPRVGCVSGEDRIEGAGGEGLYGRYELFVRRRESEIGSIVGASGSFYAQRRHLCEPFVPNLAPDFWSVLRVVEQGYRAISEPTAVGSMTHVSSMTDEFTRKVRTLLRGITTLWRYAHLMNPFVYGFFAVQLLSHKLARWLVPFFLAGALIASAVLAPASPWFAAALAGQVALYLLALAAHAAVPPFAGWRLARIAYYFTAVNVATLVAWLKDVGGVRQEIWTPSQR